MSIKKTGKFDFIEMSNQLVKKLSVDIEEKILTAQVEVGLLKR